MATAKQPCPDCGSADNLVNFANGSSWCFTPNCPGNTKRTERPHIQPIALEKRGLPEHVVAKYGAGEGYDGNFWCPYYREGHIVGYKVRTHDKKFFFHGNARQATLFGLQCASGNKALIITEGELDAMAAYHMTGYSAVSIRGASSAAGDVRANLEWLETFETVFVCTDMDVPGREAGTAIMNILKPGIGKLVVLPEGYKDACDMLAAGKQKDFKSALFAARPVNIEGVIADDVILEKAMQLFCNETARRGATTGFESLDYLLGGLRPGEVTTLVGGTGVGKTAVARQITANLASNGHRVFFVPLEMSPEIVLLQLAEMVMGSCVLTDTNATPEEVSKVAKHITEQVKFFDHYGKMEPELLLNTIEYVCRIHDIKFVVLDHLSAVVNGAEDERRATDRTIDGLKGLALRLGLHILVISHLSRSEKDTDDNNPTLGKIRHSHGIAQYSDQVLGIRRVRSTNKTQIVTLKVSRLWGQYGEAVWVWKDYHFIEDENHGSSNHSAVYISPADAGYLFDAADTLLIDKEVDYGDSGICAQILSEDSQEVVDEPIGGNEADVLGSPEGQLGDDADVCVQLLADTAISGTIGDDGGIDEQHNTVCSNSSIDPTDNSANSSGDYGDYGGLDGKETATVVRSDAERSGSEGRVPERPRESDFSGERESAAQHPQSSVSAPAPDLHPGLPVSGGGQGSDDRSEGVTDPGGTNDSDSGSSVLRLHSETIGDEDGGTGFLLSERGWSFES